MKKRRIICAKAWRYIDQMLFVQSAKVSASEKKCFQFMSVTEKLVIPMATWKRLA
ncbi:hypothetical protein EVA_17119 [gut metagenome]|uniref:Uncharacterized protein n=1 Tax=gut metagenome TaxID=749906 RepID=J9G5H7_9ZZZZ